MKPIKFSKHALENMRFRGATVDEVEETIRSEKWEPAERGRSECRKDLPFKREWNGKFYSVKQVRPIFVEETDAIAIITVYVYYF